MYFPVPLPLNSFFIANDFKIPEEFSLTIEKQHIISLVSNFLLCKNYQGFRFL